MKGTRFVVSVLVLALLVLVGHARADTPAAGPLRILVAIGARTGVAGDRPLSYANSDALRVRDLFTSLGFVRPENAIVVTDASRNAVAQAFERARALAGSEEAGNAVLIVYFSGHGDRESLHVDGQRVPLAELSVRAEAVSAALRLVILDACRTPDFAKSKGMAREPGFAISLTPRAGAAGTAWLYASADGEAAQESDEIGGAVFTHFWLSGLRGAGDTNGDGRVTLEESFAYAYSQTLLRSSRTGIVLQRPEEKLDLSETGPVVLTAIPTTGAKVTIPAGSADLLYLVYGVGSKSVLAEVFGERDRAITVVLPPGRYLVQRRDATDGAVADITLHADETRTLRPADFRPVNAEAVAQKGTYISHPWSFEIGNTVMTGIDIDASDEFAFRAGYRSGNWGVSVGPLGGWGWRLTPANQITDRYLGGELTVDRFVALGHASSLAALRMGADVRGEAIGQSVLRRDAARLTLGGFPTTTTYHGAGFGGGLHLALRLRIDPVFIDIGIRALGLGAKSDTGAEGRALVGGSVAAGVAF